MPFSLQIAKAQLLKNSLDRLSDAEEARARLEEHLRDVQSGIRHADKRIADLTEEVEELQPPSSS